MERTPPSSWFETNVRRGSRHTHFFDGDEDSGGGGSDHGGGKMKRKNTTKIERRSTAPLFIPSYANHTLPHLPHSSNSKNSSKNSSKNNSNSLRRRRDWILGFTFPYYLVLVCVLNSLTRIVVAQAPTLDTTFLYNIPASSGTESHCYDDRGNAQRWGGLANCLC